MKKILFLSFIILGLSLSGLVLAQEIPEINFFYSKTCPHCASEGKFLDQLKNDHPEVKINRYEISQKNNIDLLTQYYDDYGVSKSSRGWVPVTFVGDKYFLGFNDDIGREIEACAKEDSQFCDDCKECGRKPSDQESTLVGKNREVDLPIVGKIDVSKYSLPALTIVLGVLDGFNVCSLGALILILGLVLAMKSRKKTLLFGSIFVLTTAVVYGILIFIWYQIFAFFAPYLQIMQVLIGLLGIGGGIYFFKEFLRFRKQGPTCDVKQGSGIISRFSRNFQESFDKGSIFLMIGLVFSFAAIITIVEFPCSAAVPVVFSSILAQSNLSGLSYLGYILGFIFFYMLDEIIIFLIAFFTMKIWLTSNRVVVWITLVEAIVLFLLGIYYLFGFV